MSSSLLLCLVFFIFATSYVKAHMSMIDPPVRGSKALATKFPSEAVQVDSDVDAPLGFNSHTFPCQGKPKGTFDVDIIKAGSTKVFVISNDSGDTGNDQNRHSGGPCGFSISYGPGTSKEEKWGIIQSFPRCMATAGQPSYNIPVQIPNNLPAGKATIAWFWVSMTGEPDFYMPCSDVKIDSPVTEPIELGEMPIFQIEGGKKIPMDGFNDAVAQDIYEKYLLNAPKILVGPTVNSASAGGSGGTEPQYAEGKGDMEDGSSMLNRNVEIGPAVPNSGGAINGNRNVNTNTNVNANTDTNQGSNAEGGDEYSGMKNDFEAMIPKGDAGLGMFNEEGEELKEIDNNNVEMKSAKRGKRQAASDRCLAKKLKKRQRMQILQQLMKLM